MPDIPDLKPGETPVMGLPEVPPGFDLIEYAKASARDAHGKLATPDDDILPTISWVGPYGLGIMPLADMHDDEAKDDLATMMTTVIAVSRATEVVMTTTSWAVKATNATLDDDDLPDGVMPSQHPARIECVCLMYMTSSADTDQMIRADITRSDQPPVLGDWQHEGDGEITKIGGRFGDAVHMGFSFAKEMPPQMVSIIDDGWRDGEQGELITRFHKVFTQFTAAIDAMNEAGMKRPDGSG